MWQPASASLCSSPQKDLMTGRRNCNRSRSLSCPWSAPTTGNKRLELPENYKRLLSNEWENASPYRLRGFALHREAIVSLNVLHARTTHTPQSIGVIIFYFP